MWNLLCNGLGHKEFDFLLDISLYKLNSPPTNHVQAFILILTVLEL